MTFEEYKKAFDIRLNDQQMAAVQRVDGATLLLAVPGSGKTTVIVARTGYLIHVAGVNPDNILTITYTKAAATEMKERFIKKFGSDIKTPHFSTINAFCLSVLRTCQRDKGVHIPELEPNNERVIAQCAIKYLKEYPNDAIVRMLSQFIGKAKNEMMTSEQIAAVDCKELDFRLFYADYQNALAENDKMDFDDQLTLAYQFLQDYPDILERARQKYRYIALDEAQDTSLIQHRIVEMLVGDGGNIFMVGDEDQSIYGSRGAYPDALLNFEETYKDASVYFMETNFRSDENIVAASNMFIKGNGNRRDKNMHAFSENAGDVTLIPIADMKTQGRMVVEEIRRALQDKDHTLAVLFRNNYSAMPILNLLAKEGLGVRSRDAASVYLTNFVVKDLLNILEVIYNPWATSEFMEVYYKLGFYVKKSVIQELLEAKPHQTPTLHYLTTVLNGKAKYRAKNLKYAAHRVEKENLDPLRAIDEAIMGDFDYYSWLCKKQGEGSSMMSMEVKCNILKMIAMEYPTYKEFKEGLARIQNYQSDYSSNVTLSTMHSAKGLEFDRVILLDVVDGILPVNSQHQTVDEIEEEARLFYVGATRAKHRLDIIMPKSMFKTPLQPSEFINRFLVAGKEAPGKGKEAELLV